MSRITIFIHGTLPPDAMLHIPMVQRFFRCPKGLTSLSKLTSSHTKDILTTLCSKHPEEFPEEHCYTFGWSGTLKHKARKEAANNLYTCLAELKNKHDNPTISLLTHSHGGNVALCLKHICEANGNPEQLTIEELILLACPVQTESVQALNNTLFKEIYSLHSHHDMIQILDPQGVHTFLDNLKTYGLEFTINNLKQLGPLFSERHFPADSIVKQLNVQYPRRELFHVEFLLPQFMKELPSLIAQLKKHTKNGKSADDITHVFREH